MEGEEEQPHQVLEKIEAICEHWRAKCHYRVATENLATWISRGTTHKGTGKLKSKNSKTSGRNCSFFRQLFV